MYWCCEHVLAFSRSLRLPSWVFCLIFFFVQLLSGVWSPQKFSTGGGRTVRWAGVSVVCAAPKAHGRPAALVMACACITGHFQSHDGSVCATQMEGRCRYCTSTQKIYNHGNISIVIVICVCLPLTRVL